LPRAAEDVGFRDFPQSDPLFAPSLVSDGLPLSLACGVVVLLYAILIIPVFIKLWVAQ